MLKKSVCCTFLCWTVEDKDEAKCSFVVFSLHNFPPLTASPWQLVGGNFYQSRIVTELHSDEPPELSLFLSLYTNHLGRIC